MTIREHGESQQGPSLAQIRELASLPSNGSVYFDHVPVLLAHIDALLAQRDALQARVAELNRKLEVAEAVRSEEAFGGALSDEVGKTQRDALREALERHLARFIGLDRDADDQARAALKQVQP
jgi:DNA-binding transcriptional MerR regulator